MTEIQQDPSVVINDLRKRIVEGDEPTQEEIAEGLRLLRAQREQDTNKVKAPSKKATSSAMSDAALDDLFGG